MQLRDAKERENSWKKLKAGLEKQNSDLRVTIQEKEEDLKNAEVKIKELVRQIPQEISAFFPLT